MKIFFALLASCLPSVFFPSVIFTQWLDAYVPDFKVNDDNLNSYQTNSSIGVDSLGNFTIIWYDARNNPGNQTPGRIYCQRYDINGIQLGSNFTIGHDSSGGKISVLKDGRFIVSWVRYFHSGLSTKYEYYFQRFDNTGLPLNLPSKVLDSVFEQSDGDNNGLAIDCEDNGNFIITFALSRIFDTSKVYFQRFDSSGNKIGLLRRVNEAFSNVEIPRISLSNDGSFIIAWQDDRNGNNRFDIYLQRYNANGIKIGNNIKVNDDPDLNKDQYICGISSDKTGYSVIAWLDFRYEPISSIFYQLYDLNGNAIGINRRADISYSGYSVDEGGVSMRDDGKFFISWVENDYEGKEQIYGRRFNSNGDPIGEPYMVPLSSPGTSVQIESDNRISGDRVYVTWTDNRNGGGPLNYDIYCNIRGFQNPDTVIGILNASNTVSRFELSDPYPNPFNPATKIKFKIPVIKNGKVKITINIFDILGKLVSNLVQKDEAPGTYEMIFNAQNLSTGIYFIVMESGSGFRDFKKVILLK